MEWLGRRRLRRAFQGIRRALEAFGYDCSSITDEQLMGAVQKFGQAVLKVGASAEQAAAAIRRLHN